MKIDFKIHDKNHLIKSLLGRFDFLFSPFKKEELIVLNYHGVSSAFFDNFCKQIDYFQSKYKFIGPQDFYSYYKNELISDKPCILLTFDDGIENNYRIAQYLHQRGISAFFFIVPDYINCATEKQKDFYIKNIRPEINPYIECNEEDFRAMTWSQLSEIRKMGHELGAHTTSHTLRATSDRMHSEYEIALCKAKIQEGLKLEDKNYPSTFCSIVHTLLSVGKKEAHMIAENYRYHFTTLPASNIEKNALFIHRINVEAHWLLGAVRYACSTVDQKRWVSQVREYQKLL